MRSTLETVGEHLLGTLSVAWQPHGRRVRDFGPGQRDRALGRRRPASEIKRWKPAPTPTQALAFSPDGDMLASAAGKVVTLWSPLGEKIHAFAPAASSAVALAFDRPGTDLGVALNGETRGASHREIPLRNAALQVAGRLSHGKLQRQWTISRKRHGRWLAAFLESLDGQGFTDARL